MDNGKRQTQQESIEPSSERTDLVVFQRIMDGRDNDRHAGQMSCDSSIEIRSRSVRLKNRHSLSHQQPRQPPEGKGIEQRRQVNKMRLHSTFFHSFHKRTRFRTDQERSISSGIEMVKK